MIVWKVTDRRISLLSVVGKVYNNMEIDRITEGTRRLLVTLDKTCEKGGTCGKQTVGRNHMTSRRHC